MNDPMFSSRRLPGKLVRLPLRAIPRGTVVPVLAGPGRGLRWIVGSGPDSCWLGLNEVRKRSMFVRYLMPGAVVYDIGAHVGSYTLLASRFVGPAGQVVAFEPLEENLRYLRAHIQLNNAGNVVIQPVAVWEHTGFVRFAPAPDRVTSLVDPGGPLRVPSTTVDALVSGGRVRPPAVLKIDVEGAEGPVLRGAVWTLGFHRPVIFLATHGNEQATECRGLLQAAGYHVTTVPGHEDEQVAEPE